ncbi:MAG: hypothetical protein GOVbin4296_47 [Prokaryotic dsDNA virus sp.]|nr:MAG: hypothetical protein GOVbin4296_47 [Prokaryotic dsDNA virus sp.]|tara:strand:+ start:3607 stop:3816 length:210 start_codon:yes stop_codon:yes gene_type:complete
MIQALIIKTVIGKVMEAIEKADDKRIARSHDKRIKALEKIAHKPSDWVCLECGCKAKKSVKVKKKRRSK